MHKWKFLKIPRRQISTSSIKFALCWPKPDYGPLEVHRSNFLNGMKIAAAKPMGAGLSACCIMFQAGSRFEFDYCLGATHFIRVASNLTGLGYTGFIKSRYVQEHGGFMTCSSDRQTIAFTLCCPPPVYENLKCHLLDTAARCVFRDYELDATVKPMIKAELKRRPKEQHCLDLIQKACWGGPLSNSVYCPSGRVDSMTQNYLRNFTHNFFKTSNCCIGSVGLPFNETLSLAESLDSGTVEKHPPMCQPCSFPRAGFEYYDTGACEDTYVAVAVPGVGVCCDVRCLYKYAILAEAIGTGNVFTGSHRWNNIPHPPCKRLTLEPYTKFKAFNISYSDNGVFGILVKSKAKSIREASFVAAKWLTNLGCISCEQIEVGKRRLKMSLSIHDDDCVKMAEGLALQLANNLRVDSAKNSIDIINSINAAEVQAVALQLAARRSQMAMAVVGDVASAPDSGELVCDS